MQAVLGMEFRITRGNAIRVEALKIYLQHWQQSDVLTPHRFDNGPVFFDVHVG